MPEPEKVQDLPREDYTVPGMIFDAQLEKHRPKRKAIRPVTIATAACQFCKKRKISCTGELPCVQCERRGLECIYPVSRNKRGPKPKKPKQDQPQASPTNTSAALELCTQDVCIMPTTATAITTTPDSLMDQVKNMRSQLEIERRLTRHYRDLLLEAQRPSILSSASRLSRAQPTFSPASEKLLNNTAASLTGVITAFRMGYMVLHRHHRFSLDPDVGARFWVHFTTYLPDDFRKSVGSRDDSYLVDALEYAVTFAHGAHGVNHLDLADHFASISFELVHLLVHVKDIVSKAHFAGRISTILGALSSFCRYSFRKSAHMSLLSLCDQLLTRFPVEVNNPEIYSHNAFSTPEQQIRQFWITKLLEYTSDVDRRFFLSYSIISSCLHAGQDSPSQLHEYLRDIETKEVLVFNYGTVFSEEHRDDVVAFYRMWFVGLKCEILRRLGREEEYRRLFDEGAHIFWSIRNPTLKTILLSLAERSSLDPKYPLAVAHLFADRIRAALAASSTVEIAQDDLVEQTSSNDTSETTLPPLGSTCSFAEATEVAMADAIDDSMATVSNPTFMVTSESGEPIPMHQWELQDDSELDSTTQFTGSSTPSDVELDGDDHMDGTSPYPFSSVMSFSLPLAPCLGNGMELFSPEDNSLAIDLLSSEYGIDR